MPASSLQSGRSTTVPLAAIAGFAFSGRFALTFVVVRVFGAKDQWGAALSLALSFLLLSLAVLDRLCATAYPVVPPAAPRSVRWALLYLGFVGLSLSWSAAASLPASGAYWCGTAADVVTTVLLFRSGPAQSIAFTMMKGFIVATCIVAAAAWIMPAEYDLRLGDQDYLNANTIANLSVFGFFFAQYLTRATRTRWTTVSAILALTVLRSLSKASTAAFVISAALFFIADRSMQRRTKFFLACAATVAVLSLWGLFETYYDLYTTTGNQAETLTGRTAIWAYAADAIPERLIFGHGFDSMWKVVPEFGTFQPRHAENEVLQQLYAFGITGFFLAVAVYTSLYREMRRITDTRLYPPVACLLGYVVIRGLAEAEPFDLLFPLWAVVLFGYGMGSLPDPSTEVSMKPRMAQPSFQPALPSTGNV